MCTRWERRAGLRCLGFHSAARFCDAARKERRKGKGERRRGWDSGAPLRRLPRRFCARPAPRFPACQPLTAGAFPPPPCPGVFPGNPTRGRARSQGIPANSLPAPGALEPLPGGRPHRSAASGEHTDPGRGLSEMAWDPRDSPCARERTHTHARARAYTQARPAGRQTGPPATAFSAAGRMSRRYSLESRPVGPSLKVERRQWGPRRCEGS